MSPRDLSGFGAAPPPPRSVDVAPPPAPARAVDASPARVRRPKASQDQPAKAPAAVPPRRRKVMTALAADVHRRLREEADRRGAYKADVVLEAFERHSEALRAQAGDRRHTPRSRRRRAVEDATQCQLYLTDAERAGIDTLAAEVGLSRSGLVSRLIEMELGGEKAEAGPDL